jgi:4-hydroxyacetophenone monooxygenase
MQSVFSHVPLAQKAYRRKLWLQSEANYLNIAKDKDYPSWLYRLGETLFPMKLHNDEMQADLENFIAAQCGDDDEGRALAAACTPDYPPLCKRIVIDNEWFETLRRDDVTLVSDPILGIEPDAVVTEQGERCDVDVIVYATGFQSNEFLVPMEITGTAGCTLRETWGREPRAYLGVVAPPTFPNMYFFYGPNTNSGHHSIIAHAECQVNYVLGCCKAMLAQGLGVLDVKPEVFDGYVEEVNERMGEVVWETGGCDSWYIQDGKVVNNSPWAVSEMAWMLRKPMLDDFVIDGDDGANAPVAARL